MTKISRNSMFLDCFLWKKSQSKHWNHENFVNLSNVASMFCNVFLMFCMIKKSLEIFLKQTAEIFKLSADFLLHKILPRCVAWLAPNITDKKWKEKHLKTAGKILFLFFSFTHNKNRRQKTCGVISFPTRKVKSKTTTHYICMINHSLAPLDVLGLFLLQFKW